MSSAVRYQRLALRFALLVLALCLTCAALLLYCASILPVPGSADGVSAARRHWPDVAPLSGVDWTLFRNIRGGTAAGMGSLAQRFRLAGIFCMSTDEVDDTNVVRRAIVDNLQTKKEYVASEGDDLDGVQVIKILERSILLRQGGFEEELSMAYAGSGGTGAVALASSATGPVGDAAGRQGLSTNRFGAYVGEGRWVMSRDALLGYVEELKESPARVSELFDSMVPVYAEGTGRRRVIIGHRLQIVGEKEFYDQVGLVEGDVVKNVNSMPVTSKRRAMYWIDEFRGGRAATFVLDVERNGTPMRLEYMVR